MASSEIQIAATSPFACASFHNNLKQLVRGHIHPLIDSDTESSHLPAENNNGKNRTNGRITNNSDDNDRKSKILDRWAAKTALGMVSTIETHHQDEIDPALNAATPRFGKQKARGACSLVQIWEERLNRSNGTNSGNCSTPGAGGSRTSSVGSVAPSVAEDQSADSAKDEDNSANLTVQVKDEDNSARQSLNSQSCDSGEGERLRIADIIKKLSSEFEQGEGTGSECSPMERSRHSSAEVDHRSLSQLRTTPKLLRGRQAIQGLLAQMEQEKLKELGLLSDRRAVSEFSHRGRIQAMLRHRFLRQAMAKDDQQPKSVRPQTTSDASVSKNSSNIMHLRERFNSHCEPATTINNVASSSIPKETINSNAYDKTSPPEEEKNDQEACIVAEKGLKIEKSVSWISKVRDDVQEEVRDDVQEEVRASAIQAASEISTPHKSEVSQNLCEERSRTSANVRLRNGTNQAENLGKQATLECKGIGVTLDMQQANIAGQKKNLQKQVISEFEELSLRSDIRQGNVAGQKDNLQKQAISEFEEISLRSDIKQGNVVGQKENLQKQATSEFEEISLRSNIRQGNVAGQKENLQKQVISEFEEISLRSDIRPGNVAGQKENLQKQATSEFEEISIALEENLDKKEPSESTSYVNEWDENEEEYEANYEEGFDSAYYNWFSDIARPRSYWEDKRKAWYEEMFNTCSENNEIRKLLERRTVSNFLASDFREKMDQLMETHIQIQGNEEDVESEVSNHDRLGSLILYTSEREMRKALEQEGSKKYDQGQESRCFKVKVKEESSICHNQGVEPTEEFGSPVASVYSQTTYRSWWNSEYHEPEEVHSGQSPATQSMTENPQQDSEMAQSTTSRIDIDLVYDLKDQMEQLRRDITELRKSMHSCMEIQINFQNSMLKEKQSVPKEANDSIDKRSNNCSCCICHEMQVDAVLYRCGHMCTCIKCAHELQSNSGKCPVCRAPILDVVRTIRN